MSFLRQTLFRQARQFSTTPTARKSMLDSVKETADAVNKKIGQAAAEGIQKGQDATQSVKESTGIGASKAEGSAQEMAGQASGKASELSGEAKGKANELSGEAQGTAAKYGVGKTHATGGGEDSVVPKAAQKAVPEAVEKALPDSIHNTKN